MGKIALVLGGTGLVGSHVVNLLNNNTNFDQIIVLSRRNAFENLANVKTIVTDFKNLDFLVELPKIDSIFSCLGTTKQLTPNKQAYLDIELGIPQRVIDELTKFDNIPNKIHVVSAVGASPNSKNFYMKMKGDLQIMIQSTAIKHKYFYQPAVILGERERAERWWEKATVKISKGIDKILSGSSLKYHTIEAKQIAQAMVAYDLKDDRDEVKFLLYNEMTNS